MLLIILVKQDIPEKQLNLSSCYNRSRSNVIYKLYLHCSNEQITANCYYLALHLCLAENAPNEERQILR